MLGEIVVITYRLYMFLEFLRAIVIGVFVFVTAN